MEFIINNWPILVALLAILACAGAAVYKMLQLPRGEQLEKVREWLVWATTLAEKELGGGTGKLKLRMVYDMFVAKFPWLAKVLPFSSFSDLVNDALKDMNTMLSNNSAVQLFVNGSAAEVVDEQAEG